MATRAPARKRATSRRVQARKTSTASASQVKEPQLGKNAAFYVTSTLEKEHGKRKAKEIVAKARAIAVKRQDRVIRFEYVLVAEGKAKEREFGSKKLETLRRQLQTLRVPRKARVAARKKQTTAPRARRVRPNAKRTAAKRSSTRRAKA